MKEDDETPLIAKPDSPSPTRFSDLMTTISSGEFDAEVTKDLASIIDGCADEKSGVTGGVITIKLTVKRGDRKVRVIPTHTAKTSKKGVDSDDYYVDGHGRLTKNDPKQTKLRFAPKGGATVVDITKKPKSED